MSDETVSRASTDLQSNKEIVRHFIAETNAQNFSAYEEVLTADLVQHFPGGIDKDRQVVEENERMFAAAFPDISRTIEDLIAEGDKVVARTSLRGTHLGDFGGISATGRPIQFTGLVVYRIAEGRIAESWVEFDVISLMSQISDVDAADQ
jgi:predicted ester cyclase